MTAPSALPLLLPTLLKSVQIHRAFIVLLLVLITIITFVTQTQRHHCLRANDDFDSEHHKRVDKRRVIKNVKTFDWWLGFFLVLSRLWATAAWS